MRVVDWDSVATLIPCGLLVGTESPHTTVRSAANVRRTGPYVFSVLSGRTTSSRFLVFLRAFYAASLSISFVLALAAPSRTVRAWRPVGVIR